MFSPSKDLDKYFQEFRNWWLWLLRWLSLDFIVRLGALKQQAVTNVDSVLHHHMVSQGYNEFAELQRKTWKRNTHMGKAISNSSDIDFSQGHYNSWPIV